MGEGFVGVEYVHRVSRAGDAQLHSHVVMANMTRADGRWTTLDGRALYAHLKTASALYHAELRAELTRRLGVEWEPVAPGKLAAEIRGVPRAVLRDHSRRRQEILRRMEERGESSPRAAQAAALDTRKAKDFCLADRRTPKGPAETTPPQSDHRTPRLRPPAAVAWPSQCVALAGAGERPRPRTGWGRKPPEVDRVPSSSPAPCGDEAQLFTSHHATLRARVCRHVHTSASNVDDACSFAWLQLLRCQPRRATVLEWLTTVAIHEALRLDRTDRRLAPLEAVGEPSTPSTTLTHEQAREALEIVAALPPRQRQLAGMHAAGFTYDEIALLSGARCVVVVGLCGLRIGDMSSPGARG